MESRRIQGNGALAPVLKTPPKDLTAISRRRAGKFPEDEVVAFIDGRTVFPAHGTREMPVWGRRFAADAGGRSIGEEVSSGKIEALLHFLKSIQE